MGLLEYTPDGAVGIHPLMGLLEYVLKPFKRYARYVRGGVHPTGT
jgi:hypothetical protein